MRIALILAASFSLMAGDQPPQGPKARLGRYLFYDRRLSVNGTTSCATCHRQELAFTDGRAQAEGATGQLHPRSAMSLVNLASSHVYNWSDPSVHALEQQALKPMFSTSPIELGLSGKRAAVLKLFHDDQVYAALFPRAFPGQAAPFTIANAVTAIASFERTMISRNSAWDKFHMGDASAISESAKRGEILFFLDYGPSCFRCHNGPNFTDGEFHNTALYLSYPTPNRGLFEHTGRAQDAGRFKTPTLRNVALTAPYMHDGSIATLEEVLDHYAAGGRAPTNALKDQLMHGFVMTPQNRSDLVAFLRSLTDDEFIHNPGLSNPWNR